MVGYDPGSSSSHTPLYISGVSGCISAFVTRAVSQPLDVLKIRLQLQEEPIRRSHASKYHSTVHACRTILREERFSAFWKGHVPAQALSIVFGIVEFSSFQLLTTFVGHALPHQLSIEYRPFTHFVCGSLAGVCATLAAQPFDVVRTRFVAQSHPKVYSSTLDAMTQIVRKEGALALYRGLTPTLLQIAPQTGFQFGFYSGFSLLWDVWGKQSTTQSTPPEQSTGVGALKSLVCGSAAGAGSKLVVHPLDLVKKRLQIQGFIYGASGHVKSPRPYTGFIDCTRGIVRHEGLVGLYKGLNASLIKAVVGTGLLFFTYEQSYIFLLHLYQLRHST